MASVLQAWTEEMGLRHQGVLITAVRGCDIVSKEDPAKALTRCLRAEFLNCFCGDPAKASSFIEAVEFDELERRMWAFIKSFDHYPIHFVLHLMHASEIIGMKKSRLVGDINSAKPGSYPLKWLWFYQSMCRKMHLNPETERELDSRLNANEDDFKAMSDK